MLSKLSYINLVIREVFPTLCSPRKTNLNFLRGLPKSPEVDMFTAPWPAYGLQYRYTALCLK